MSSTHLARLAGPARPCYSRPAGRVAEWFKAAVLKTAVGASPPWVRIPPLPPVQNLQQGGTMRSQIFTLAAACCLAASVASAQSYRIIEQDTHLITLVVVESITSSNISTRNFSTVSIYAWPDISKDIYGQIVESKGEINCVNHEIKPLTEDSVIRDIRGNHIATAISQDITWRISDGYEAYGQFFCNNEPVVSVAPFKNMDEVKRYYFDWLDRNVPRISASRP